jgi:hypothetical protein
MPPARTYLVRGPGAAEVLPIDRLTGFDAARLWKQPWPGCRIDASAFVEKVGGQPSELPVSRGA